MRLRQIGRHAGNGVERRALGLQRGNGVLQRAGVGMRGVREQFIASSARSTMRPAYITCTRSQKPETTPRSCVIEDHRHAEFALHFFDELENLRLHGDIERGGGLVGDEQFGLGDERHRDHHALAHAAGKFMRITADALGGVRACPLRRAWRCRVRARPPWLIFSWISSGSMICSEIRRYGLSEVIGSWKIIEMRLPRMLLNCSGRAVQQIDAVEHRGAAFDPARRLRDQAA